MRICWIVDATACIFGRMTVMLFLTRLFRGAIHTKDSLRGAEAGDVFGVGWYPTKQVVFMTRNGNIIQGSVKQHAAPDMQTQCTITVRASEGVIITANFGRLEYTFAVRGLGFRTR